MFIDPLIIPTQLQVTNTSCSKFALPFDKQVERVCYALHKLDDFRVGEVCTRVAIDGHHFIPLTQARV